MPELPEVETVRRGLHSLIIGKTVKRVDFDWQKSFPNAPGDALAFLVGAKVTDVRRRAKVLMIDLDTSYSLVVHLKMTGQLVYVKQESLVDNSWKLVDRKVKKPTTNYHLPSTADEVRFGAGHPNDSLINKLPDKSTRVILHFEDETDDKVIASELHTRKKRSAQQDVLNVRRASTGDSDNVGGHKRWQSFALSPKTGQRGASLYFNDQRKFGWMRLMPTIEIPNIDFMKKVGPEPLNKEFTPKIFIERIRKRNNSVIKAALLDQTVLAGVGNIYADESLWGAKIHPATRLKDVTDSKLNTLHEEIRFVLELSIEKGGSTDRNYVNAEGKKGSYIEFARVFRKEGKDCPSHVGTAIIKIRVAGRGTHICPKCQKQ